VSHEEWGKWPLIASPHGLKYIRLLFAVSSTISPLFRLYNRAACALETRAAGQLLERSEADILAGKALAGATLAQIGILIVDDDVVSQRALKNVLDSEGWRVRIVPLASAAMLELASGEWNLVIVNVAMTDVRGPLFYTLRDLAQGAADAPKDATIDTASPKGIRVLFLVPMLAAKQAQPVLEHEGLPYLLKPYHLHDFLEKVGELLVEAGALADPIRSMRDFASSTKKRRGVRTARTSRRNTMFASRDDYQMSEEDLLEWERAEEEEKKKREKQIKDREHL
jgi:CheY-like chemotaxis protein